MRAKERGWRTVTAGAVMTLGWVVGPDPVRAIQEARPVQQDGLEAAVGWARDAWMAHDMAGLVSRSDTVRLHLPGISSASVRPAQAARLLQDYLKTAEELGFTLRDVRRLASDHAYAEMARHYLVRGTSEEREETVFLGYRVVEGVWRLREVRVTP